MKNTAGKSAKYFSMSVVVPRDQCYYYIYICDALRLPLPSCCLSMSVFDWITASHRMVAYSWGSALYNRKDIVSGALDSITASHRMDRLVACSQIGQIRRIHSFSKLSFLDWINASHRIMPSAYGDTLRMWYVFFAGALEWVNSFHRMLACSYIFRFPKLLLGS